MSDSEKSQAQVHLRLSFPNGGGLDEADMALIETIKRCRSILGASKLMGLSYRKTWLMTDALKPHVRIESHRDVPRTAGCGGGGDGLRRAACGAVPLGGTALVHRGRRGNRRAYGFS